MLLPIAEQWQILNCVGHAFNGMAPVMVAKNKVTNKKIAVRICELDRPEIEFQALQREVLTLRQLQHPNILPCLFCVIEDRILYLAFPLMDYGSVNDLIQARFIYGLSELLIAFIVIEVVKALQQFHGSDFVHRAIRCSHILVSADGSGKILLSGFRYATNLLQRGRRLQTVHEFPPDSPANLYWFAPELLQQNLLGYGTKSDIYSLGIAICEMANGFPPFSDMEPMQMMLEKLKGTTPRLLDSETIAQPSSPQSNPDSESAGQPVPLEQRTRRFSAPFHTFTELCLKSDPNQRPSATELLGHSFFKQLRKNKRTLPELLHPLTPCYFSPSKAGTKVPAEVEKLEKLSFASDDEQSWQL